MGPRAGLDHVDSNSDQLVDSRYTDCAIPAADKCMQNGVRRQGGRDWPQTAGSVTASGAERGSLLSLGVARARATL